MPGHVLDVAVQSHARIEEHGDGRPGAARKAALEKAVDGDAGLPQARCIGHPDHPAVPEKPQRGIPLVSPGSHRPGAAPVLPARRLQIQQVHEIGFAGLHLGVQARQIQFLH